MTVDKTCFLHRRWHTFRHHPFAFHSVSVRINKCDSDSERIQYTYWTNSTKIPKLNAGHFLHWTLCLSIDLAGDSITVRVRLIIECSHLWWLTGNRGNQNHRWRIELTDAWVCHAIYYTYECHRFDAAHLDNSVWLWRGDPPARRTFDDFFCVYILMSSVF